MLGLVVKSRTTGVAPIRAFMRARRLAAMPSPPGRATAPTGCSAGTPGIGCNALLVRPMAAPTLLPNQLSKKPICHPTSSN